MKTTEINEKQTTLGSTFQVKILSKESDGTYLARLVPVPGNEAIPDEITLEAKKALKLICGESKILVKDDEVVIRSEDVSTHAKRLIRIKGAAVSVN
jgi:hypothetical protein